MTTLRKTLLGLGLAALAPFAANAESSILNASYDVSRELYKDINPAFVAHWKQTKGADITVNQSHGGSTKQAKAVAEGLEADVVTLNQATDLDFLASKDVVDKDWKSKFPHDAAPYTTTSIFIVRQGNPKGIKDWSDLVKPGVSVVIPNPKTSGNGRYTYLAAWGYALGADKSEDKAREFVSKLFANVPVFDGGGRGATTTFTQRDVGDVLVTFENEVALLKTEFGDKFDVIYPSISIEAAPPVAINKVITAKRGTAELAKGYLDFLYTPAAQKIIAKHGFRPWDKDALAEAKLPEIKTFKVEDKISSWADAQKKHFADGGIYDQITTTKSN
ncbi:MULTISPECIES: sulfate ABC transporter substrate-binding protein [Hyphomicrobium]|jgi:sulfate transport system substrate-binding protein|uniref:sulfate ABC transporter substrate-binding protein n=1 Tax=Hyphomicrobium TaxID=81 RepID=UPI0003686FD2|nr:MULTISPECIES: sulfate ABC transporter substrate-binding protein [Hyphomicrobium]WBT37650.1 sulfate ABC transporter substrate-binding protein [Hyphomicrobium sp. DMF-1]HML41600.1 sulfate ABC transporter substrate-binding protein [Hyphomicrobium zavarzinii]